MSRSMPIDIRTKSSQSPSSESGSSYSSLGSGLYIPIHKRMSGNSASSSGTASSPPAYSARGSYPQEQGEEVVGKLHAIEAIYDQKPMMSSRTAHPFVYFPADLILLSRSPLAKLSPEGRTLLKDTAPEILSNRRQRKAAAYLSGSVDGQKASNESNTITTPDSVPRKPISVRRSRAVGRVPNRRQLQSKVMDEANWRGRRVGAEIMAVVNPI